MDTENLRDLVKRYEDNRQFITNEETGNNSVPDQLNRRTLFLQMRGSKVVGKP